MVKRIRRFGVGVIACAAILAGAVSAAGPASASAAHGTYSLAAAPSVPTITKQNLEYVIINVWNGECLDGRLGTGHVTLMPCGRDTTHEYWYFPEYPGDPNGFYIANVFNRECLDGRLGTGHVTLKPCSSDTTHEDWQSPTFPADPPSFYVTDVFNRECLDGRLGTGHVTLLRCHTDTTHEAWRVRLAVS